MVIPIGGIGASMPPGPFPQAVEKRAKVIKICVLSMIAGTIGELIAGLLLGMFFNVLSNSLNLVMSTLVGIWLLKHDPLIGQIHSFFARTCCATCEEQGQCGGGCSCLVPFIASNIIAVLLNVLMGGEIQELQKEYNILVAAGSTTVFGLKIGLFFISTLMTLVAQIAGSVAAYLAYRDIRDMGLNVTQGDPDWQPYRQGGGTQVRDVTPSAPPQQQRLFEGAGNRLGS